ncbi:formylglycine-generating enzyme family protein [Nodosilinea sp. LEGE 07298]|uniref:formylglycine-generating enzyme family protein n=1 Tax=Nodosilinea sp. LEGE 07298 TaxID=2777970 RepID=UPI0037CC8912
MRLALSWGIQASHEMPLPIYPVSFGTPFTTTLSGLFCTTKEGAPTNGSAWLTDDEDAARVIRGGSWKSPQGDCRSACRLNDYPRDSFDTIGFRVACTIPKALK